MGYEVWNAYTQYTTNDVVQYLGGTYQAIQTSVNIVPTNASYWVSYGGGGGNVLLTGLIGVSSITWIQQIGTGAWVGTIPNVSPNLTSTSKVNITTEVINNGNIVNTITSMTSAWIIGVQISSPNLVVYLAAYPNATNNSGAPPDAGYGLSWVVNGF